MYKVIKVTGFGEEYQLWSSIGYSYLSNQEKETLAIEHFLSIAKGSVGQLTSLRLERLGQEIMRFQSKSFGSYNQEYPTSLKEKTNV